MKIVAEKIVDHPWAAVAVLALLLLPFLLQLGDLAIDTSAEGLMVRDDPAAEVYRAYREDFGSDTMTAVVIRAPGGDIFTSDGLEVVQTLSAELYGLDGVSAVSSLTTVTEVSGDGDFLSTDVLIEEVPEDVDELAEIRRRALANDILVDTLVSADGAVAAINVFTDPGESDEDFNRRFSEAVDELIERHGAGFEIYQIGAPISAYSFTRSINRDQRGLVPYSALILLVFLLLAFRSVVGVVVPMVTGGLSILATLGFMALMGYPVNVVTALVPSILIAVGCTEDVHMLSKYRQELRGGRSKIDAVRATAVHSALPITLTSLTTVIGFATLSVNKITILKHFGIVSSFGLLANFVITMVMVPILLRLLPTPGGGARSTVDGVELGRLSSLVVRPAVAALGHRRRTAAVVGAVVAAAVVGCFLLEVNSDFTSYFRSGSLVRTRVEAINRDLAGAHTLNIVVRSGREDGIKDPEVLAGIAALQEQINRMPAFAKSISLVDYLRRMHRAMNAETAEEGDLPEGEDLVAQYLLFLDDEEISRYVDETYATANVVVFNKLEGSRDLAAALAELQAWVDGSMDKDLEVQVTGEWVLINGSADAMVAGQVQSLMLALGAIFIIMSVLFMSLKAGLVALIANIIPVVVNFGVMGWLGIPLNTGTCMVAAIALGIAVDDTIHFMVRYQRELRDSDDQATAMTRTLLTQGEPVVLTSAALFLGFGVLVLSSFNPTVHFGVLAALVMLYALLSDLFVNPVVLLAVQLITLWDFLQLKLKKDITRSSPVFRGLSTAQAKKIVLLGSVRTVEAGDFIVRQDEEGTEMYLIVAGGARVDLEKEGKTVEISALREGDLLGEMAIIGGGVRTASAVATQTTDLLRIDQSSLDRIRRRFPRIAARLFMNIAQVLGDRLRLQNLATFDFASREGFRSEDED